ncbi:TPA: hypothetical protein ACX6MH_002418 [Photobacterium damselae]
MNDLETVKKEKNPTKRVSYEDILFYEKNKYIIYSIRIAISIAIMFFYNGSNMVYLLLLILPIFIWYNSIRSRLNLFVHFLLVNLRFTLPIIIVIDEINYMIVFFSVLVFPVINLLERMGEKRFDFPVFQKIHKNINLFRVEYYLVLLLFTIFISNLYPLQVNIIICVALYFTYRLLISMMFKETR